MKPNLLISTFYEEPPIIACIAKLQVDKIILLTDMPIIDIQKRALEKILMLFEKNIHVVTEEIDLYDFIAIAKKTMKIIEENATKYNIVVNVSGGRKTQALGAIYGASLKHDKIDRIIYVMKENNEIVELPIFCIGLSNSKLKILNYLNDGMSVQDISKKTNTTKSMIYNHIRNLKEKGFIDNSNHLTLAGKISVLK